MIKFEVRKAYTYFVSTTIILLLSTLLPHSVIAGINEAFTYQGKIVNDDGTNVTNTEASCISTGGADTCDFRISLYTAVSGGTLVWQETKSDVELHDDDGIFNLVLNCGGTFSSCNQNGGPEFTSGQLFIQVEFDPDGDGDFLEGETFDPRREFTAVPYSFSAKSADTLDGIDSLGFLRSNSSDTFEAGNTMTFEGAVDINGEVSIADTNIVFDGANTDLAFVGDLTINTNDFFVRKSDGYTGIGTTDPNSALEVNGNITIGDQNWIGLDSGAARIEFDDNATDEIALMNALIGIGTTAPSALLDIFGGNVNITKNDGSDVQLSFVGDSNSVTWSIGAEDSINADFIISEGADLNTPRLFIEASTGLISVGGTTPNAFLDLPAATTSYATIRINSGTQPTSPGSGDLYSNGSNLYYYNGSGWDDLTSGAAGLQGVYEAGNTLELGSATGNLGIDLSSASMQITVGEGTDTGDFKIWDGSLDWFFIDEDADTMVMGTAAGGGVTIDAQTGQINIGNSNNAKQIDIGTGTATDTLNLATDATAGDTISIGNSHTSTTLELTGGDDWSISNSGNASFGSATITTGALAVNSDSITSDGAILTINAGGTVNIQDNLDIGGSLTGVTELSSSGDWTWTATTPEITINSSETFTITDGTDTFSINTTDSSFSLTDGTNSMAFDVDTGPSYAGTARPTRQITLSPEFQGASFTGDGASNTGTMTSDFCENGAHADIPNTNTGVCNTSGDIHNYYSWTTSEASVQDYDIWVRWRVPDNFSAWAASNPIQVYGKRTDSSNNAVTVYVYDTSGAIENSGGTQVAGNGSWTQTSVAASFSGTYTAGSYMTFRIVVAADTGGDSVQAGEISLDYLTSN